MATSSTGFSPENPPYQGGKQPQAPGLVPFGKNIVAVVSIEEVTELGAP